jgi:hypothetical protein
MRTNKRREILSVAILPMLLMIPPSSLSGSAMQSKTPMRVPNDAARQRELGPRYHLRPITVGIDPTNAGPGTAVQLTVTLYSIADADQHVQLSSFQQGQFTDWQNEIVIPAGYRSKTITLHTITNTLGADVTITATNDGYSQSGNMSVTSPISD